MDVAVALGAKGLVVVLLRAIDDAADYVVREEHLNSAIAACCSPEETQKIRALFTR
jgi:hypothetical protein